MSDFQQLFADLDTEGLQNNVNKIHDDNKNNKLRTLHEATFEKGFFGSKRAEIGQLFCHRPVFLFQSFLKPTNSRQIIRIAEEKNQTCNAQPRLQTAAQTLP